MIRWLHSGLNCQPTARLKIITRTRPTCLPPTAAGVAAVRPGQAATFRQRPICIQSSVTPRRNVHRSRWGSLFKSPARRHCSTIARMSTPIVSASSAAAPEDFRLPTDVRPSHYDVTIRTDLEKLTFDGFVKIECVERWVSPCMRNLNFSCSLDVKKATSTIVFNSCDLNLENITVRSDALQTSQTESSRSFEKEQERMHVHFATPLPAGSKAQLQIAFDGKLTGSMMGYYYSSFEQDGETKYYTLTQFEPTAARRSFPCWDEPALKATFAITLISRASTVNLSNMPAISEEVYTAKPEPEGTISAITQWISSLALGRESEEKWKITKFDTTPPVSTDAVKQTSECTHGSVLDVFVHCGVRQRSICPP
jgi:hypothetical protein